MKSEITDIVKLACKLKFDQDVEINLDRPEIQFGDFSTNIAMQLASKLHKSPLDIANDLAEHLNETNKFKIVEAVKPGFLNIHLKDEDILSILSEEISWQKTNLDKQILVEYGDPNPFKEMHIGHVYSSIIGDVISSLLVSSGAEVKRLIYQGDVGLNIAKGIYGIGEYIDWDVSLLESTTKEKSIGYFYATGEKAFNSIPAAKDKIKMINVSVYTKDNEVVNKIYDFGKQMSFDAFEQIFNKLGVHFDHRYLESQSAVIGKQLVEDNVGKVFDKSEGAIIYRGEQDGLYTAVFINSQGLPTYQAKDLGLTVLKFSDFPDTDQSIIITGNEQTDYFRLVFAALTKINPDVAKKSIHIGHGLVSLSTGKMSSRTGDVYTGSDLIDSVKQAIDKQYPDSKVKDAIFMSAIRYNFIKYRIGPNIVFDPKESVAIEGNSGPYILYAHARARNILAKIPKSNSQLDLNKITLQSDERKLIALMGQFSETIEMSIAEFLPHQICTYLYQLAQEFNSFYEKNRVVGDDRQDFRSEIVSHYAKILKTGLDLLHIPAPDYM
jgi:arginyl-tRNA synthetase